MYSGSPPESLLFSLGGNTIDVTRLPVSAGDAIKTLPEVPQVAFSGGQSCQGVEDLLQNELPVLLVAREHLKGQNDNGGANLFILK